MKQLIAAFSIVFSTFVYAGDLPDPLITPGAIDPNITQDNIQETVCVKGYTKTVRPPAYYTNKLKKSQLREYGFADQNPKHYEEDHLIPLNIGGAPEDRLNLWPQTRTSEWNASKKDVLELKLYKLVCNGSVPLEDARQAMATDWIKAYKQYVGTKNGQANYCLSVTWILCKRQVLLLRHTPLELNSKPIQRWLPIA